jgi:hypothetical protein
MFATYGVAKEARKCGSEPTHASDTLPVLSTQLFDLMMPIILALALYGDKLKWAPRRKARPLDAPRSAS